MRTRGGPPTLLRFGIRLRTRQVPEPAGRTGTRAWAGALFRRGVRVQQHKGRPLVVVGGGKPPSGVETAACFERGSRPCRNGQLVGLPPATRSRTTPGRC